MIAMLFVSFYARLPPPLPFSTSESDLPKPSRPSPLQVLSAPTAPAPDVTPKPALAAIAATPAPAPDVTTEPALAAIAATPAPAPDVTPSPHSLPRRRPSWRLKFCQRSSPRRVRRGLRRHPRKSASPQPDQPALLARSPVRSWPGHEIEISARLRGKCHRTSRH